MKISLGRPVSRLLPTFELSLSLATFCISVLDCLIKRYLLNVSQRLPVARYPFPSDAVFVCGCLRRRGQFLRHIIETFKKTFNFQNSVRNLFLFIIKIIEDERETENLLFYSMAFVHSENHQVFLNT